MQPGKICPQCQSTTDAQAVMCLRCGYQFAPNMGQPGYPYYAPVPIDNSKKIAAGICAILLGSLGIHKFILGYRTAGIVMLLVSILSCGLAAAVIHIIAIIEGIVYLSMPDAQFHQTYVVGQKEWF